MKYRELSNEEIKEMKDDDTDNELTEFTLEEFDTLRSLGFTIAAFPNDPEIYAFYEYGDGCCIDAYCCTLYDSGRKTYRLSIFNTITDLQWDRWANRENFITFEDLLDYLEG